MMGLRPAITPHLAKKREEVVWYTQYSKARQREYYYEPNSQTTSWVLPEGCYLSPHDYCDDNDSSSPNVRRKSLESLFDEYEHDAEKTEASEEADVLDSFVDEEVIFADPKLRRRLVSLSLVIVLTLILALAAFSHLYLSHYYTGIAVAPLIVKKKQEEPQTTVPTPENITVNELQRARLEINNELFPSSASDSKPTQEIQNQFEATVTDAGDKILERIRSEIESHGYVVVSVDDATAPTSANNVSALPDFLGETVCRLQDKAEEKALGQRWLQKLPEPLRRLLSDKFVCRLPFACYLIRQPCQDKVFSFDTEEFVSQIMTIE